MWAITKAMSTAFVPRAAVCMFYTATNCRRVMISAIKLFLQPDFSFFTIIFTLFIAQKLVEAEGYRIKYKERN